MNAKPCPTHWHKFVPFAPYAEVINAYFRLFLEYQGIVARTATHIRRQGPDYPDFTHPDVLALVPEGFRLQKPGAMQPQAGRYHPVESTLRHLLMNAVYIGHWVVKDQVVQWFNHPAIVPEAVFFAAFNYLSEYTLDGLPNPHYRPGDRRRWAAAARIADFPRPLLEGLVVSDDAGQRRPCSVMRMGRTPAPSYVLLYRYPLKGFYKSALARKKATPISSAVDWA
jgi:hypothetical protein